MNGFRSVWRFVWRGMVPVILLWSGFWGTALAEAVRVIGGEHAGFTRIVLDLDRPSGWRFGRVPGGYEVRLDRQDIAMDLSTAFDLIPRDRVAALTVGPRGSSLSLTTGCFCHADLVELDGDVLVIDVRDGPAPSASLFELALDREPAQPTPVARRVEELSPLEQERLGLYWRNVRPDRGGPAVATPARSPEQFPEPGPEPDAVPPEGPDPAQVAEAERFARALAGAADAENRGPEAGHPAVPVAGPEPAGLDEPAPPSDLVRAGAGPEVPRTVAAAAPAASSHSVAAHDPSPGAPPILDAMPVQEAGPELAGFPPAVDPRVAEAQALLVHQIGRAASQGLLEVEARDLPATRRDIVERETGWTVDGPAVPAEPPAAEPEAADPTEHLAIRAETSIDRDSLPDGAGPQVSDVGAPCLPDTALEIAAWGDDTEASLQLSTARQSLVGEFDQAAPEAVSALARLYLHFGFGAEARETLQAFDVPVKDKDLLMAMAAIMDHGSTVDPGPLAAMADCDTAVALWSVLARPTLSAGDAVDARAVARSFSRLPLHLRRHLGPILVERFLGKGDEATARVIRDAITRAPGEPGPAVRIASAQLDLTRDKTAEAEAGLLKVIAEDGPVSPEAVVLYVETRLANREAVDPATVETAAALAFEHRGTDQGRQLSRAQVLGMASSGRFDAAFEAKASLTAEGPDVAPAPLNEPLFSLLLRKADEATFLRHLFGSADAIAGRGLSRDLRRGLAERLLGSGFAREARTLLAADGPADDRDRLLLGRAALKDRDAAAALTEIAGLDGKEAAEIRAGALSLLGAHATAAEAFAEAEQPAEQAAAAWRAGDRSALASMGSGDLQAAVARLIDPPPGASAQPRAAAADAASTLAGAAPLPGSVAEAFPAEPGAETTSGADPALPPEGSLAQSRSLLDESRASRDALTALLEAFPAAAPPAP